MSLEFEPAVAPASDSPRRHQRRTAPRPDRNAPAATRRTRAKATAQATASTALDPDDVRNRDPEFISRLLPYLDAVTRVYFRPEVEGAHHVPAKGPFICVGNHNAGPVLPDLWTILAFWARTRGPEFPMYGMVHDAVFKFPVTGTVIAKIGGVRASQEGGHRVLAMGGGLLVYPGGELDCCRTFWDRNRIDLHGRSGFVKLAFQHGAPIVPFVNIGGHETLITLVSSRRLARWTGLEWLTRVKTFTVNLGLPWGIFATPLVFFLPLPAK